MQSEKPSVVLVGTIYNVESSILKELDTVVSSLSVLNLVKVILIESDSSDSTKEILLGLQESMRNLEVISLGDLKSTIPNRIERIRYCRQKYVLEVRLLMEKEQINYVAIADLDGMNSQLTSSAVSSCFVRDDWDVVTANQKYGYYDLLALRHSTWCPGDVMDSLRKKQDELRLNLSDSHFFVTRFFIRMKFDSVRRKVIYSKMKRIPRNSKWIEVDSAFGGFALYKAWIFQSVNYEPTMFESEHVLFNRRIRELSGRIFINPALINNYFNTYNISRFFLIRQGRDLIWNSKPYRRLKKLN